MDTALDTPEQTMQEREAQQLQLAENAMLGILLNRAEQQPEVLSEVVPIANPDDLQNGLNKKVLTAMMELDAAGKPYTVVEVFESLGGPKSAVKVEYLLDLMKFAEKYSHAFEVTQYARKIREASERRRLINAAESILKLARSGEYGDNRELFNRAEELLAGVEPTEIIKSGPVPVTSLLNNYMDTIEERYKQAKSGAVPQMGILTKLIDLDMLWTGLKPRKYYVIAARPAMGKTAFLLHLLLNATEREDTHAVMFSAEMAKDEEMINRMVSNRGRVDAGRLQTGMLDDNDWKNFTMAIGTLTPRFEIDDTPHMTITHIKREARKIRKRIGPDKKLIIAIDYLQLIEGPRNLQDDEYRLTSYVSKELNNLKKELDATVIALSQLNRKLEDRKVDDRRPRMTDLRGSGQIEQDADLIAFLYRDEVYNPSTPHKGVLEVITAKQRAGKTGTACLAFLKQFGRFESLSLPPGA